MLTLLASFQPLIAQTPSSVVSDNSAKSASDSPSSDVLSDAEWKQVDESVDRALRWLARQQMPDGSFPTDRYGQPGVTSLCVLAFLASGHTPGHGPYGARLTQAVKYIASCQKPNGLIAVIGPIGQPITRRVSRNVGETVTYNHGIASLALSEAFSMSPDSSNAKLQSALKRAVRATLEMQGWQKTRAVDHGGWRYVDRLYTDGELVDSNLSNTAWQLMFLRSAKNAGFDIEKRHINDAVGFIRRCFNPKYGTFVLMPSHFDHRTRGMSGAGVIALSLAGQHKSAEAHAAGDWILKNTFLDYNRVVPFGQVGWLDDRYHYGVFYCTLATHQLGGRYWREFFPPMVKVLLANQHPEGSWQAESHSNDNKFGNAYTTSLMVLSLAAHNQLLPVLQR